MKIVTVCGSLRANSSNAAILEAYCEIAAANEFDVARLDSLRALPHFDSEVTDELLPIEVLKMRELIHSADLVAFSTPEYIHAMPAILKNCLEWLVGDPRFYQKPVVILHANSNSTFALESLKEVLSTMSATLIEKASTTLSISDNRITSSQILANSAWREALEKSVQVATNLINLES